MDDNRDAADSLALLLGNEGYEVMTVYDGETALERMLTECPPVVLLDLGLPGMDGYGVARAIRQRAEFQSIRLVALTGYGQPEDREQCKAAGFDAHLVKPVELAVLLEVLAKLKAAGD